jgi:hypothetical protein
MRKLLTRTEFEITLKSNRRTEDNRCEMKLANLRWETVLHSPYDSQIRCTGRTAVTKKTKGEEMTKPERANFKALEVADNLRKEILEIDPDMLNVWVPCYPGEFPATMTITLSTLETDIINPDYLRWLPKRKSSIKKSPCPFSAPTMDLLNRVEERIRYYGGIREGSTKEPETADFYFLYTGPLLQDNDVSLAIKTAAKKVGMTGAAFMKFWNRYSWKIKEDVRPYTSTVLFSFWY